ncbi:hypothetical protein IWQ60_004137 [Tieghemiomyces parasiticus]|uniref:Major facilitator superfamily (MFS) profile domain-containing protein n=1 Tax=Tieghemiomyces parasiticus TaxID=78921 RepID=A0A9W8AE80_9FUNG|nr:hypothetical protein IWQ60_004137 [Tieghemiomyces parasiticus]
MGVIEFIDRLRNKQGTIIVVVGMAVFTDMLLYGIVVPVLPTMLEGMVSNASQANGFLFGIYALGLIIGGLGFGGLSDRYQIRQVPMCVLLIVLGLATMTFGLAKEYWQLLLARLVQGLAGGGTWAIGFGMIIDMNPPSRAITVLGSVMACSTMGTLLGPTLGGFLYEAGGRKAPFIFGGCLCFLDLLLRIFIGETAGWKEEHAALAQEEAKGRLEDNPVAVESGEGAGTEDHHLRASMAPTVVPSATDGDESKVDTATTEHDEPTGEGEKRQSSQSAATAAANLPARSLPGPPERDLTQSSNIQTGPSLTNPPPRYSVAGDAAPSARPSTTGGERPSFAVRRQSITIQTSDDLGENSMYTLVGQPSLDMGNRPLSTHPKLSMSEGSRPVTPHKRRRRRSVISINIQKRPVGARAMLTSWKLVMCFLTTMAASLSVTSLETILPLHLGSKFGLKPGIIGLMFMAAVIPNAIVSPVMGWVLSRYQWDRHLTMSGCMLYLAVLYPLVALATQVWLQVILLVLTGLGFASLLFSPTPYMVVHMHETQNECYGLLTAINNAFYATGMLIGPVISGNLYAHLSFLECNLIITGFLIFLSAMVSSHHIVKLFRGRFVGYRRPADTTNAPLPGQSA